MSTASTADARRNSILAYSFAITIALFAIGIATFAVTADACTATSYTLTSTAPTTNWNDTTKWTPSGFPGGCAGDTANIGLTGMTMNVNVTLQPIVLNITSGCPVTIPSGGSMSLQSSSSATSSSSFTVNGGSFGVDTGNSVTFQAPVTLNTGSLTVAGTMATTNGAQLNINGGTINGGGTITIPSGHAMTFSGSSGAMVLTSSVNIDNFGSVTLSSASNSLSINSAAHITNESTGAIGLSGDAPINTDGISSPSIEINGGTFAKTGGTDSVINVTVNNTGGTVSAGTATLELLGGGTHSGIFTISGSTSKMRFNGTHVFAAGSSVTAGALGTWELLGGTFNVNTALTVPTMKQTGGTLAGSAAFGTTSGYEWAGGDQNGSSGGSTSVNNSTFKIDPTTAVTLNARTVSGSGSWIYIPGAGGSLTVQNGAQMNLSGGTFDLQSDTAIAGDAASSVNILAGTLKKTTGTKTIVGCALNVNGTGALQPSGNTISFGNGGSIGGSSVTVDTSVSGSIVEFSGGTTALNPGVTFTSANLALSGSGALTVNNNYTVANVSQDATSTLTGNGGALTISGTYNWNGGTISSLIGLTTVVNLSAAGIMNMTGTTGAMTLTNSAQISSSGTINYNTATNALAVNSGGRISTSNALNLSSTVGITSDNLSSPLLLMSSGSITKNGSGTLVVAPAMNFSGGTVNVTGTLRFTGGGVFGTTTLNPATATDRFELTGTTSTTFSSANWSGSGTLAVSTPVTTNAWLSIIANLELNSGGTISVSSPQTLQVTNLKWTGGGFNGGGFVQMQPAGSTNLTALTAAPTLASITFNNFGTVNYNPTFALTFNGSAIFANQSGATFTIAGNGTTAVSSTGNSFTNAGTVQKTSGGGIFTFTVPFTQSAGTTNCSDPASTIAFSAGGNSMSGGSLTASNATANINFSGGSFTIGGGTLSGIGTTELTGASLTFSVNTTLPATFTMSSGTLTASSAALTVPSGATFNWSGGTITGTAGASMTIAGGGTLAADTTTSSLIWNAISLLINATGAFNWNAGANSLIIQGGAPVNDSGTFSVGVNATLGNNAGGSFAVNGQFTHNGSGTLNVTLPLNVQSGGTITSSGGGTIVLLDPAGVSHAGTFDAQSGSLITFGAGTHTFNSGAGFSAGTGTYKVAGATLNLATNVTAPNVFLFSGSISGSGNLTTTSSFNWQGGAMSGSGTTTVASGTAGLTTGALSLSRSAFTLSAPTTLNDLNGLDVVGSTITNNSTFTIQSGNVTCASCTASFVNNGTLASTTVGFSTLAVPVTGSGALTVSSGTFSDLANSTFNTATINSGASALFSGISTIGSVGGTGLIQIPAGTTTVTGALTLTSGGAITVSGGTLTLNGASATDTLNLTSGTLNGSGALAIGSTSSWTGGAMSGSGTTTFNGSLSIDGSTAPESLSRNVVFNAPVNYTGPNATNVLTVGSNVTITNNSTFTYTNRNIGSGTATFFNNGASGSLLRTSGAAGTLSFGPSVSNAGTATFSVGTTDFPNAYLQTGGTTTLSGGNLSSANGFTFAGGSLLGSGTITANVANSGATVNPGTAIAPGTLTVNGTYNQTSGTLIADVFGNGSNDQLAVPGNTANVAGNLNLQLGGAYTPSNGDSYTVITAGTLNDSTTKSYPTFGPNNTGFMTASATPTVLTITATVPVADLQVAPTAPATVVHNNTWTVTIPVMNNGPNSATSVSVTLTATGGTFASTPTSGTFSCSGSSTTQTCTAASLGNGSSGTISAPIIATSLAGVSLAASVTAPQTDSNSSNNSATVSAAVSPQADLALVITDSPDPVNAGATVVYSYAVTNNGPDSATPTVSATISNATISGVTGCQSFTSTTASCTGASLASGASTTFTINVTAPPSGTITASGSVSPGASAVDQVSGNDSATQTTTVTPQADLQLTKAGPISAQAGTNVTYTVTLTNAGPSTAANVQISDATPAGLTFASNSGGCTSAYPCTFASLVSGASVTITSTYSIPPNATGSIANTASATSSTGDPNGANNSATANTIIGIATDLSVTKSGPSSALPGSTIAYDVTVTNNGPSDATGVVLSDPTPARLTFVSATGACTSYPCTIGTLPTGQSASMHATYTVTAGPQTTIVNTASVTSTTNDPITSNDSASVSTSTGCPSGPPSSPAPANGATNVAVNGFLHWSDVGAASYNVYFGPAGSGCTTLVGSVTATQFAYSNLTPGAQYEWRIEAVTSGCQTQSSACFTFTTFTTCPTTPPSLVAPANGASVTSPVNFSWTAAQGATSYTLFAGVNGAAPTAIGTTTSTSLSATLASGSVSWFVVANVGGNCPPLTSESGNFNGCTTAAPPVPAVVGTAASSETYFVTWDLVAGAARYEIDEATKQDFSDAVTQSITVGKVGFTHGAAGVPLAFYYRVRSFSACDQKLSDNSGVLRVVIIPIAAKVTSKGQTPSINVPAGSTQPATQIVHVPGFATGPVPFTASVDQPYMSVQPASGILPPDGLDFTITIDPTGLDNGTVTGTLILSFPASAAGRYGTNGSTTSSTPVSVNLVTPVSPTTKGAPPANALVIPSVGHLAGINSQWQSDVRITNAGTSAGKYALTFTPGDGSSVKQTTITITGGETTALDDIIRNWYGVGLLGDSANGVLTIAPLDSGSTGKDAASTVNIQTVASSRTYNVTANGTLGQYIPAIPFASFIGVANAQKAAGILSLQQIQQNDNYRTNLGLVEANGKTASVLVTAFDSSGAKLFDFPVTLAPNEQKQLNGFLAQQGVTSLSDGRFEVKVTGGDGKITAYASLVDNRSGDPLLISGIPAGSISANHYVLPGVADLNNGLASWRSDVRIFNGGTVPEFATLTFYPQNNGGDPTTTSVSVDPGQVKQLDAILNTQFNLANIGGALHVSTGDNSSLVVTGRTYNLASDGSTYGQFIPAVTAADGVGKGGPTLHILQVEDSVRYRTNVGVAELTGKPATVQMTVFVPNAKSAPTATISLGPNEYKQFDVIQSLGLTNVYNARVSVRVVDGDGKVTAYGSVIDMITQDPTYVPAQQ